MARSRILRVSDQGLATRGAPARLRDLWEGHAPMAVVPTFGLLSPDNDSRLKVRELRRGEVWRAKDTRLDRDVAIKILPQGFAADEKLLARFEREARAISKLAGREPAASRSDAQSVARRVSAWGLVGSRSSERRQAQQIQNAF